MSRGRLLNVKPPRLAKTVRQDLETLCRGLRLIYTVVPRHAAAHALLTFIEALLPAASIWLLKWIIDTVAAATRGPVAPAVTGRTALALAGSYFLLVGLQQSVRAVSRLLHGQTSDLLIGRLTERVMEKASAYPDLSPFESPRFHDRLQLLQQEVAWRPMSLFASLAQGLQSSLSLFLMLLFLARFHPGVVLVLALTAGPGVLYQRRLQQVAWLGLLDVIPLRRRLNNYAQVLLTAPYAKEVRLFGFSRQILGRYREQFHEMTARVGHTRWRMVAGSVALSLLAAAGVGGVFAYVISQALQGAVTLGDLSLYVGALFQASSAAAGVTSALGMIHETLPFTRELLAFLDSTPTVGSGVQAFGRSGVQEGPKRAEGQELRVESPAKTPLSGHSPLTSHLSPRRGYRFEQVTFHYPDSERPVFERLELEIPWGKTTALVGENGAGKSTLVKLMTRLYDPLAGRVLLDGIDLREYDLDDLRRHIAVVFQDFARYQLPAWENIGLGDVDRLDDRCRIREAARRAGADAVIRRLPLGEETMLGREFDGGVELSGGEWQKIALARAFMRDAPIVILDEPTAALDSRSEYDLFRRFVDLAAGRTTLLISHRFSTVRMADRIVVLEHGQVVEEGDHRSLVGSGGRYAELYTMQAEHYQR